MYAWITLAALWKYFNFHGNIFQYCTSSDISLRNHLNLNISIKSIRDNHLTINSRVPEGKRFKISRSQFKSLD